MVACMESLHSQINPEAYKTTRQSKFRSRRDELVSLITDGINGYRVGTKWKPITARTVALLINRNPALAKDDGEIELLYKECMAKGSFSKLFWVVKGVIDRKDLQRNMDSI